MMMLTAINLAYYQELMAELRAAIAAGRFDDTIARIKEDWARGDADARKQLRARACFHEPSAMHLEILRARLAGSPSRSTSAIRRAIGRR